MKLTVICNRVSKKVDIQDFDLYRCLRKESVEQDGEQMPSCLQLSHHRVHPHVGKDAYGGERRLEKDQGIPNYQGKHDDSRNRDKNRKVYASVNIVIKQAGLRNHIVVSQLDIILLIVLSLNNYNIFTMLLLYTTQFILCW